VYRPSFRRSPAFRTKAVNYARSEFSQTLRNAFQDEEDEPTGLAPQAPASRWGQGALESLILVLVRLATLAVGLAVWRIASDLGLFWRFVFSSGVLSHWQVWFALGVLLSGSALTLSRRLQLTQADEAGANQAQAA
ncbi:MAG: hypothetical protein ABSC08_17245, partial [Bryobacteraceae bacterium]